MLKLSLFLFGLTLSISSFGQMNLNCEGARFESGPLNSETGRDPNIIRTVKSKSGDYLVFKKEVIRGPGGWNYYLESFNEGLETKKVINVTEQFEDENFRVVEILEFGNSFWLFSEKREREIKTETLYVQELDVDGGQLGELKEIFQGQYEGKRNGYSFSIQESVGGSKLLVRIDPPYVAKESLNFVILSESCEIENEIKDFKIEKQDKNYVISDVLLTDKGKILILGNSFENVKRGLFSVKGNLEHELILCDGNSIESTTQIELENNLIIDDISLSNTKNGQIYLGGYYTKEKGIGIDGMFLYPVNVESGSLEEGLYSEFPKEFITEGWSERQKTKAKKKEDKGKDLGLTNLQFRDVMNHSDGSMTIIGEVFWITVHTSTDANGNISTTTVTHYGDLVVTKVDSEGEVVYTSRINKHFTYFGAYTYFDLNNNLAIVLKGKRAPLANANWQDLPKKELKKIKGEVIKLGNFDNEGNLTECALLDYRNDEYKRYRRYKDIWSSSLIETEESIEIILSTYFGSKKFGISRFTIERD